MKPQHDISDIKHMDNTDGDRFTFLGNVYEIDVYRNNWLSQMGRVVGPDSRLPSAIRKDLMWTSFKYDPIRDRIELYDDDVHVGVHHLVEIYRLMKENPHETKTQG